MTVGFGSPGENSKPRASGAEDRARPRPRGVPTLQPPPQGPPVDRDGGEPLARLLTAARAIEGLRDLFTAEEAFDGAAMRVAAATVEAIASAHMVSVTVLTWPHPRTAAATDDRARKLDERQYATGRGPCLEAALDHTPVRALVGDTGRLRWPEFAAAARRAGVRSSLSVPLLVADEEFVGSLNVYSFAAAAFDSFDEALLRIYTVAAGQAITNGRRWHESRETVRQLELAVTSRQEIDLAKGVLMAMHGCDEVEAFEKLKTESQKHNVKLRVVAQQLLGYVRKPPTN